MSDEFSKWVSETMPIWTKRLGLTDDNSAWFRTALLEAHARGVHEERARTQGPDYIVRHDRSKGGGEPTIVEHKSGREK